MGISYEKCTKDRGADVLKVLQKALKEFHPDLVEAKVTIDCLFAFGPDDDEGVIPVKLHGYPCQAVVRRTGLKERAKGCADAEIVIDEGNWNSLHVNEQLALIDHELEHLVVVKKDGEIQRDDLGRPKLKMKLHDYEIGGFENVTKRHKDASAEVRNYKAFHDKHGQYLMDFLNAG